MNPRRFLMIVKCLYIEVKMKENVNAFFFKQSTTTLLHVV